MEKKSFGLAKRPRFATTNWSVVLRAGADTEAAQHALAELFQAYWYPLYAYLRRLGRSDHDAKDLTQGFFMHLLDSDALERVSPEKGRFRSFLLASMNNFAANQRRAAQAVRRGGAVDTVSLTAPDFCSRYDCEPLDEETPELLFQRRWVEALLARVRQRLEDDYRRAHKEELFHLLEPHLIDSADALPRAEIGHRLRLSPAAVAMSIHRMRRRYGELLREEVGATVDDPAEIEDELRTLMAVLGRVN